jgi:hypothetical protein
MILLRASRRNLPAGAAYRSTANAMFTVVRYSLM